MSIKQRNELKNKLIDIFSKQSEVEKIILFGKEVEGIVDDYSDIDIIIISKDLRQTQLNYKNLISKISPIFDTLLLESKKDSLAEMIILKNYSPYQKIDLSIHNNIKILEKFNNIIVYNKNSDWQLSSTELELVNQPPIENTLYDYIFSIPRFTKCLYRKDINMYRRWKGISDYALVLLYEKHFGWSIDFNIRKLGIVENNRLIKKLDENNFNLLEDIFPTSGNISLPISFLQSLKLIISLTIEKSEYYEVEINKIFIDYMERFLTDEINKFAS